MPGCGRDCPKVEWNWVQIITVVQSIQCTVINLRFVKIMKDRKIFRLANGIRVVHQRIPTTAIVHCGIVLDVGSRDENPDNQGIAHFWEHMAFKGTKKRKTLDIISSLDSVGGELNAYTDKEKIAFYASVRKEYFELARRRAEFRIRTASDRDVDSSFADRAGRGRHAASAFASGRVYSNDCDACRDDDRERRRQ